MIDGHRDGEKWTISDYVKAAISLAAIVGILWSLVGDVEGCLTRSRCFDAGGAWVRSCTGNWASDCDAGCEVDRVEHDRRVSDHARRLGLELDTGGAR